MLLFVKNKISQHIVMRLLLPTAARKCYLALTCWILCECRVTSLIETHSFRIIFIYSFIHILTLISLGVMGGWSQSQHVGVKAGYILDKQPVHGRADIQRQTTIHTHNHTCRQRNMVKTLKCPRGPQIGIMLEYIHVHKPENTPTRMECVLTANPRRQSEPSCCCLQLFQTCSEQK